MTDCEWRPIETAPRNGERVFLWWDGDFSPIGYWSDDGWAYPMTEGWNGSTGEIIQDALLGYGPTNWMPLPTTPNERKVDE